MGGDAGQCRRRATAVGSAGQASVAAREEEWRAMLGELCFVE